MPCARKVARLLAQALRRCSGFERGEQTLRDPRDVFDCGVEGRLVCLGRLVEAGYLPHVLQRSGIYLLIGCRWREVEKCLDVPTHGTRPPDWVTDRMTQSPSVCLSCNKRWIRPSNSRVHLSLSPSTLHRAVQPRPPVRIARRLCRVGYADNDTQDVDRPKTQSCHISSES